MDAEELDSSLEMEMEEFDANAAGEENVVVESVESIEPPRRGRPFIPLKWTAVISLDQDDPVKMTLKELAPDMQLAQAERRVANTRRERLWAPLFCPRKFITDQDAMDLERFKLTPASLKNHGIAITKLRKRIEKEALKTAEEKDYNLKEAIKEVEVLAKIVRQRGTPHDSIKTMLSQPDFKEPVPIGMRRRSRRRAVLSVDEKINIVHKVLVEFEYQKDVAKEYRISIQTVSTLVSKAKKKPEFLRELWDKRSKKEEKVTAAVQNVSQMINNHEIIDSADKVTTTLNERTA